MIAEFFENETYEVTLHTNLGTLIDTITVTDFSLLDLSSIHTTKREGNVFVAWYIDSDLSIDYLPNNDYKRNFELFSKFDVITFNVSIRSSCLLDLHRNNVIYS
jgi:hypothetical protein